MNESDYRAFIATARASRADGESAHDMRNEIDRLVSQLTSIYERSLLRQRFTFRSIICMLTGWLAVISLVYMPSPTRYFCALVWAASAIFQGVMMFLDWRRLRRMEAHDG